MPFAVSIVSSSCRQPHNMLRIINIRHSSSGDVDYAANFSVCVPPIFDSFDNVPDLIEFIEVNRVLGAQKFQFYVDCVGPRVDPCLREYARRGIVDIQPWTLPPDIAGVIYYHGQILAINECLYRMMYRTKYLVIQDLDEFVVPMSSDNWVTMLDSINSLTGTDSERIASYNFRNRFFPTELSNASNFSSTNSVEHRFKTLVVLQADKDLFPITNRSKVMARPDRVTIWHVHLILDSSLVHTGDINAEVPAECGQLFHYRRDITVANTIAECRMSKFEEVILRHLRVGAAAICLTDDYL